MTDNTNRDPADTTGQTPDRDRDRNRADAAALALNALSSEESLRVLRTAETDIEVARDIEDYRAVAAELGAAVEPVEPSAGMRASILDQIARMPQVGTDTPTPQSEGSAAAPAPAPAPAPVPAPAAVTPITRTRGWRARTVVLAAAAALALFFGGMLANRVFFTPAAPPEAQPTQTTAPDTTGALVDLLAADDLQRAAAPVTGGGNATVMWSGSLGQAAIAAHSLAELPDSQVYEMWFIRNEEAVPAGTFTTADANGGLTWALLDGTMAAGDAIGVTIEPEGGSPAPTTDPIVVVQS